MAKAWEVEGLSPKKSLETCARRIITTRFREMMSYREGVVEGSDIEFVHDMRVSSRRLRAAMENFSACFSDERKAFRGYLRQVKALTHVLGVVRDLDVLIHRFEKDVKTLPQAERVGIEKLIARLRGQRQDARKPMLVMFALLDADDFAKQFLKFFEV